MNVKKKKITIRITDEMNDAIEAFAAENHISKTVAIRLAIQFYLKVTNPETWSRRHEHQSNQD